MKIKSGILAGLILLCAAPVIGQQPGPGTGGFGGGLGRRGPPLPVDTSALTRFSLDFPGGKPRELVAAIQKALGKPLNAIVPDELTEVRLPALKMTSVNAAELFDALLRVSMKHVAYVTSTYYGGGSGGRPGSSYSTSYTSYGFKTEGTPTDDSIWYFVEDKPALPPYAEGLQSRACRFYSLKPYLDRGLTVDDITTAIQTGWKMLGDEDTPRISFHKETKLLIAVGDASKLETIDAVLKALEPPMPAAKPSSGTNAGAPPPAKAPEPKSEE